MNIDDERLMRYADGELDDGEQRAVEAALAADAALARRVEALRAQRRRLADAFAGALDEPVPERLRRLVESAPLPAQLKVVDLGERRTARRLTERVRAWSWPEAGAVAASLLLGVLIAREAGRPGGEEPLRAQAGTLVAGRAIAQALSTQLASEQSPAAAVRVGLTFENREGRLCRTFVAPSVSGIACRAGRDWQIGLALAGRGGSSGPGTDGLRAAGSDMPPAIVQAVEAQIRGEPFDAAGEARARSHDWQSPPR